MKKINLTNKRSSASPAKNTQENEPEITNMMLDPRYLRQSSALIQEALQKGFDVLQLANGDIVTTGTKTVVYQYSWDEERGKLLKSKPDNRKGRKSAEDIDEEEEVESDA